MLNKLKRLLTYFTVWKITAGNQFQEVVINRGSSILFFVGKSIRFAMSLVFLFLIHQNVANFSGYTIDQIIIFFLTYNFVDLIAQTIYRGVYNFTHLIRTGEFDYVMSKPLNPLFRPLFGDPDAIDTIFLVPVTLTSLFIISQLSITITLTSALIYGLLLVNSFLIATALHILVLCTGILATEVDGAIWLYRDISRLGQFPITIYIEPIKFALFFLIPIGMMYTIPAQVLTNLTPSLNIGLVSLFGIGFFLISLKIWSWSLKQYASASS